MAEGSANINEFLIDLPRRLSSPSTRFLTKCSFVVGDLDGGSSLSLETDKAGQITILDIYIICNHSQVAPLEGNYSRTSSVTADL